MRDTSISFAMVPLAAVGLVAAFLMLMVALGLLGVLWQNVTQRTREMGLRRAKGAAKVDVQRQILAEIGVMTSLALLAGVLVAIQFPLLDIIYFVEPHVYAIGLAISVSRHLSSDPGVRVVPEPDGDAGGTCRGVAVRVANCRLQIDDCRLRRGNAYGPC